MVKVALFCAAALLDANATLAQKASFNIDGKVSVFQVIRDKSNEYAPNSGSTYTVSLNITTKKVYNTTLTVGGYLNGDTGLSGDDSKSNIKVSGGMFLGDATKGTTSSLAKFTPFLGNFYLTYKDNLRTIKVGHQMLNTPMTKTMYSAVPNFYESAVLSCNRLRPFNITLAHITKMAYGSKSLTDFGLIGDGSLTAGASVASKNHRAEFLNMGALALAKSTKSGIVLGKNTNGVSAISLNYKKSGLSTRLWQYIAYDISKISYADIDYTLPLKAKGLKLQLSSQAMYENYDNSMNISSANVVGAKVGFLYAKTKLFLAYNHSNSSKFLTPWGGDPAYTSSVFSKNAYRPDVTAVKIIGSYKIPDFQGALPKNMSLTVAHGNFSKSSLKNAQKDATETDIALKYKPKKNILFKLANVQRETEFDGYKGKEKTQNMTKFVMKYKF